MIALDQFIEIMRPAIEQELALSVAVANGANLAEFHQMMAYHLGWEGEGAGPAARGKRVRPLLLLLTSAAAGAAWQAALPAAAAVELIHNFSLIHDDIEDNSSYRRGRRTVWAIWGIPQAVNTGDAMFTLAHLSMLRLGKTISPQAALQANQILQETCLQLTQGQFLDMSYESRNDLSLEAYWPMVSGKTAALLAACTEIGALTANVDEITQKAYRQFGWNLGLAFQALDDWLGIWGDAAITGKSTESDLVSGKKSLPILYGLSQQGNFAKRWAQGTIQPGEATMLAQLLVDEGSQAYIQERASHYTDEALAALSQAYPQGDAGAALHDLALKLLRRQG